MYCLVTGGAGFIGSHICEELVERGHKVVSIDNYVTGKENNHVDGVTYLKEDVTDRAAMDSAMKDVDIVFHNAASKKTVCMKDPLRDLHVNAGGTFILLELAVKHKVKKFIHASTGSVYGEPVITPQSEDHPLCPTSYYGTSKLAGERYAWVFKTLYGLDVSILRYFHVYGDRQDSSNEGGVVSIFRDRIKRGLAITIHGDGEQERTFTYVKDVVRANMAVIDNPGIYNVSSGVKTTINQLVIYISNLLGKKPIIRYGDSLPGDIRYFDIDTRKIKALIDFTRLDKGLKNTICSSWT